MTDRETPQTLRDWPTEYAASRRRRLAQGDGRVRDTVKAAQLADEVHGEQPDAALARDEGSGEG